MQSNVVLRSCSSAVAALSAVSTRVVSLASSCRMLSRCSSSSSTTSTVRSSLVNLSLSAQQCAMQFLTVDGFQQGAGRTHLARRARVVGRRDDLHGHVAGQRIALQAVEHREARVIG